MSEATLAESIPVNGGVTLVLHSSIGSDAERSLRGSVSADFEGVFDAEGFTVTVKTRVRQDAASALRFLKAVKFRKLADMWRKETRHSSSVNRMAMHPAYQQIIGMGRDALPLILHELERTRAHWLWALYAINGEDVAPEGSTFDEAVDAWLNWGRKENLI